MEAYYEANKYRYPRKSWHGKTIKDLAQKVDQGNTKKPLENWYVAMNDIESEYVHSESGVINNYILDKSNSLYIKHNSDEEVPPSVAEDATLYFLTVISCVIQAFRLNEDNIKAARSRFDDIMKR